MSRRLRAPMRRRSNPCAGRFSWAGLRLAVYPDDGEQQEILIRVADERLYQLKNAAQLQRRRSSSAETRPAPTPGKKFLLPGPISEASETPEATGPPWRPAMERVSLAGTRAYA